MATTLNDMPAKKKPDPSAEEIARELVRLTQEQGLSLTGPGGLLKQFTKNVLETVLNEELTEHQLGHEKNRVAEGRDSTNVLNGAQPKTVLTGASGPVELEVPRDRDGTFEPVIVRNDNADWARSMRSCSRFMPEA